MKLFFTLAFCAMATLVHASDVAKDVVGKVIKVEGSVKVAQIGSIKKSTLKVDQNIHKDELISTATSSLVVIKLNDASDLVVDEKSSLSFHSEQEMEQTEGKVYYKITSRQAANALKVKTPFSIIGIKGTEFIVDTDKEDASIKLKEGLLGIESIKEEFELYRKKVQADYEKFVSSQTDAFEEYKNAQVKGFAQKTKAFDLHKQNTLSFDGNTVSEKAWSAEDDAEFSRFENMIR